MAQKTALLLGATGLTGGFLLTELINSGAYSKIIVPARRHLATDNPIVDQVVTDFKNLDAIKDRLVADDVYCCLGTTIAVAKTKEAFRFVDYELPLAFAKIAKEQGAKSFNLMSSIGAKAGTSNFYLKTKGEVERDIAALPFKRVNIFRPSMLLGPRKETRSGESIGKVVMTGLNFLWKGPLKNYKPIESADVAKAMAKIGVRGEGSGLRILESAEIQAVADKK
jgi:uncharacterized protein YbjT (DUF2867 family)